MDDNQKGLGVLIIIGLAAWAFSKSGSSSAKDEASEYDNVPDTQKPKGMSYAIFNRNPGNIKKSNHLVYPGEITPNGSTFKKFKNYAHGWSGMFIHLKRYFMGKVTGKKLDTIRKIISTWAPPSDGNQTENYIQYVVKATGKDDEDEIDINDKTFMISMVKAMSMREDNRTPKNDTEMEEGWTIANTFTIV
jgi:hypothetical protein